MLASGLLIGTAGCGFDDGLSRRDAAPPTGTPAPTRTAPAPATPSANPADRQLRLAFAGDVHFTGRTVALLDEPRSAFGPIAEVLRDADLTLVNLETAVTDRGTPEPKPYLFRAPTTAYEALRAAGIDAVSIANNHALDYGRVGLLDTLDSARSARFPVFGAGRDVTEAYAPWLTTVDGVRIAVVGFSQVHALSEQWKPTSTRPGIAMAFDRDRAVGAVAAAHRQADLVIVFMHWGIEGSACPSGEMKSIAGALAGAGADIVVGTHAHTLLADGWLGRTYVHYGLGNFLWYGTSRSTDSGVLRLTVRGREVIRNEFVPAIVSGTGQPRLVSGSAERAIRDKLATARRCTGLSPTK
ncbi:CapA family protein [Micromonospora coerulea]|uniref:CapA family protein n=2 Tax=Micromonospora coerulea TaxID=47856 RepID=A0ABP8S9U5_9ACTN